MKPFEYPKIYEVLMNNKGAKLLVIYAQCYEASIEGVNKDCLGYGSDLQSALEDLERML